MHNTTGIYTEPSSFILIGLAVLFSNDAQRLMLFGPVSNLDMLALTLTVSKLISESMDLDPASLSALFISIRNLVLQNNGTENIKVQRECLRVVM